MRLSPLRQPDQRSCGAATLVMARMLREPAYRRTVLNRAVFAREVLALHGRVTGIVDVSGRLQLPWPRALGTPPWAVARQLSWRSSSGYAVRPARGPARRGAVAAVVRAVEAGDLAVLYVGSRWLPRHVVLVTGGDEAALRVYDPGPGVERPLAVRALERGWMRFGRWDRLWFVVAPRTTRRTGAGS